MTNIFLTTNALDEAWCFDSLKDYIRTDAKVLLLTFSVNSSPDVMKKPFLSYGIEKDRVIVLDLKKSDYITVEQELNECDILAFIGNGPDKMYERVEELGIKKEQFLEKEVVIGCGAGALLQLERYHITPNEEHKEFSYGQGVGLVKGMDLELNYDCSYGHKMAIRRANKELKKPVYAIPNDGGVIVEKGQVQPIGKVTVFEA